MKHFVYILRTSSNTLYIGQTNDLERRLEEHKSKSPRSAKYVRYYDSHKLVYQEKHHTRSDAMRREAQLKKWSRSQKEALIKEGLT
ncbi:GIY-YIG nuclease family protein [Patescibacteria group bacterium]